MSFVSLVKDDVRLAVAQVDEFGNAVKAAQSVTLAPTTGIAAAARDEVSAAVAAVFSSHGRTFQSLCTQAVAFNEKFTGTLVSALSSYVSTETTAIEGFLTNPLDTAARAFAPLNPRTAASTIGLVMGGSGIPLPNFNIPNYVSIADQLYIHPNFPDTTYPNPYANGLFTPEYAIGAVPFSMNFPTATTGILAGFPALNTSMGQGLLILENAIKTNLANGVNSTVFGWSQSSSISGLVMERLDPSGQPSPNSGLQFVLVGDPSAPNGGLLQRYTGLSMPSFGIQFGGSTPSNSYPTSIYTLEYDGYADFPKYPINFLADLNAVIGFEAVHQLYLTPQIITPAVLSHAILLPGSENLGTQNLTNYYMIPTSALPYPHNYLPLLQPLLDVPLVGKPLADLLQPDLSVLVNLGYGPNNVGYSTPANIPTPIGLFPDIAPATLMHQLAGGAAQGWNAFVGDIQHEVAPMPITGSAIAQLPIPGFAHGWDAASLPSFDPLPTVTRIANTLSTASTSLLYPVLPIAALASDLLTAVPAYNLGLFMANISNPLYALALPIAADVGIATVAGYVATAILLQNWLGAAASVLSLVA